ncbi:MAG TPA: hypothetical protein VJ485_04195 [archaeon]|nr:hypothetical protein [archaeon]
MYKICDVEGFKEFVKDKFAIEYDGKVRPINPLGNYPTCRDGKPMPFGHMEGDGKDFFRSYLDDDKTGEEIIKPVLGEFIKLAFRHNLLAVSARNSKKPRIYQNIYQSI